MWQSRLNDLRNYKKEHGDCLVPNRYKGHRRLGEWVQTQRCLYKKSLLRKDRMEALEVEGFVWCKPTFTFQNRLLEFIAYREIYGTCSVPQDFPSYQEFGNWVHTTRKEYIKLRDGKPSQLTLDRFEALDAEGFIWVEEEHLPWRERFLQLVEFKKQFGHCNVSYPTHDCKALARWVRYQRDEYWKHYVGEKSTMTREKIEELENIGFVWCLRARRSG
uniref:Helicase-associated domain-containing protein n=1 Tax=Leptocylindrus danicus TaxID=163516 RepID=A0A7S2K6L1_9STRA